MYEFDAPSFGDYFDSANLAFWKKYTGHTTDYWWASMDDMKEAAKKKGDAQMLEYLDALGEYEDVAHKYSLDGWEYPTAEELASRRRTIEEIRSKCLHHASGPLAERWALLEMRTNMMLKRYADNISLWDKRGKDAPDGYVKEKMRNIYANALLHTDKKLAAWNIYADQNDGQSLLWSARKHTNLAGIKRLFALYPDAPVHKYLLKKYVNTLQEAVDYYYDELHQKAEDAEGDGDAGPDYDFNNYWADLHGDAYAPISKDYLKEIKEFVAFADSAAQSGRTSDPCMWETASALCAYYLGHYRQAQALINKAMSMKGDTGIKDTARRIRMLIACSADDVESADFRKWMAAEIKWLDEKIAKNPNDQNAQNARDRILNLGLTKGFEEKKDMAMARLAGVWRDYVRGNKDYMASTMIGDIYPYTSQQIKQLFAALEHPGSDPLTQYAASKINLSDDFKNDILGTKLIQEGKFKEALPYLQAVSMPYLNRQRIAFYAARRDYHIPAWYGHQTVGDIDYEAASKPQNLKRNVKVDFCREILRLEAQRDTASMPLKDKIDLELATALYQASARGQCWYISTYGTNTYSNDPPKDDLLADKAKNLLKSASGSSDPNVKAAALFGLVYTSPDKWRTTDGEWVNGSFKDKVNVHAHSKQYAALETLNTFLLSHPAAALPIFSRCDVLKQWRKQK